MSAQQPSVIVGLGPMDERTVSGVLGEGFALISDPTPEQLQSADGAVVRAGAKVDEAALNCMPRLKVLARTGVGLNNVDVEAATRHGVAVCITPGSNSHAVAEGTIAHMLYLVKRLPEFRQALVSGNWEQRERIFSGDLEGKTLGIIGYGRIGARVAQLAAAFGMHLTVFDPVAAVPADLSADLTSVLKDADVVSIHVPLTAATRNLINSQALETMKDGAILINVSRGGLVDEEAVYVALQSGKLLGYGVDAFEPEPPEVSDLHRHPRCLATPHILGISQNASKNNFTMAAVCIRELLTGGTPGGLVNPEVLAAN